MIFIKLDFKRLPVSPDFRRPKSSRRATVLHLFRFKKFFQIFSISASTKIITSAIYSTRTAATKLEIMDRCALNNISAFSASDRVSNNSRHNHFLINTFQFSPLLSVGRRSKSLIVIFSDSICHFSKWESI